MTDRADAPIERDWTPRSRPRRTRPRGSAAAGRAGPRATPSIARSSEIKDAVLRMGTLVEEADPPGQPGRWSTMTRRWRSTSSRATRGSTRPSATVSRLISVTIATQQPVARDLRYLLTLDHVTYELERMGDHAVVAREAGHQARPGAAARAATCTCRRWPSGRRSWSTVSCGRWSTPTRSPRARSRSLDDDIDRLYHATFDELLELMRADPANVERGTRIIIASHYIERIGDRATNIAEDIVYLVTGEVEDLNP